MSRKIFVTVGTTKFDNLITTVTSSAVLEELNKRGYNHLTLQIGNTTLKPDCTPRHGFQTIEFFTLKPTIKEYVKSADLVISHAGAGSCLEALGELKPLIVVTNDLLMDNHQLELAQQLYKDGHLYYCTCSNLHKLIASMDLTKLKPLIRDSRKIANQIDKLMGF
ncbi:UDP-N-acetylglucosamine transferase subunit ALG13 homolog [Venturia canescens]|uniref:UDP-N-acetylglucosamine transferase subunit ALG13 homolog n=1 Tax=Venturia canescens TaxID=32260 RepID=UPI001C9C023C|nr:UDP-N-acetylglucosamine transferase subunit ALG13 homolog [Venturia canescens]